MKKLTHILLFSGVVLLSVQSCTAQKKTVNHEIETTSDGKMLLGVQTKSQLLKAPYSEWYNPEHDSYIVDQKTITELKKVNLSSYNIVMALGTWCGDSHREVPRFMKILETLNFSDDKLTIIAVDRNKESPDGAEKTYSFGLVPTIMVQRDGKEIGRIVEYPTSGYLEKDLLAILKKDALNR